MGIEKSIMCMPSLCPVLEPPIRDHRLVVCMPALLKHGVQHSLNQCEPICIGLPKFEVAQFVFSRESGFTKEGFSGTRTVSDVFVLHNLIGFNIVEGNYH